MSPRAPSRHALRLGAAAVGLGAAFLLGSQAGKAAEELAPDPAPAATSGTKPQPAPEPKRTQPTPVAKKEARPEPKAAPKPAAPTHTPTGPPPDPVPASEPAEPTPYQPDSPVPASAVEQSAATTPESTAATAAPDAIDLAPIVAPDACGGDCGNDMRSWITGRSYDSGTDTWTVTTVADVFSEVGCYVTPTCVVRLDTSGAPLQGPPLVLACALGWAATGDGGCRKSDGSATGEGFKATVTTTPGAPAYFELPFMLTWEHLDVQIPVGFSANPVFLDAPVTVVGDCPRTTVAGTTFTCTLQVQIPPGTTAPATMYFFGGGDPDRPDLAAVSLTTTDPNWSCAGTFCQTSSPVVGAWTEFTSIGATLASARGGHAVVWGAAPVIPPPSGNPFGYALGIRVVAPDDPDVPITLVPPAQVHPGEPATVVVTFTNSGATAAPEPMFVIGVLADLTTKSFTAETPPGWTCSTGAPDGSGDDGPFVTCTNPGGSLDAGEAVTIGFTFVLRDDYDTSVPLPFIAFSQWGPGTDNVRPHHFATAVAAVTPAATPEPGPGPEPGDPRDVDETPRARARQAALASSGLPSTGDDPLGLLGLGTALLAAGTALTRRKRNEA